MERIEYELNQKIGECLYLKDVSIRPRKCLFKCICGKDFIAALSNVKYGNQISCGCIKNAKTSARFKTHGLSVNAKKGKRVAPEYSAYHTMMYRCHNPKDKHYQWYGARGIAVCDRWRESFENFIEDMGFKPDPKLSLDRIDNEKGYSKDNCRWATHKEQCNNRRSNLKYKASNNLNPI